MKRMLMALIMLFVLTSCAAPLKLKVKFVGETGIMPRSDVMLEDEVIGKVTKVESDEKKTIVSIIIDPKYRDKMNTKTLFFRVGEKDDERVMVILREGNDAVMLKDGDSVDGMGEVMYYSLRSGKSVTNKVKEFFESREWKEFREDVSGKIKSAFDATKEELDEETYEIRQKAVEFIEKMKEKYGEDFADRVMEFTDSVIEEMKIK
ncbi:MAG: hypothetical protein AB7T10_06560 [bacterium]